jgi:hypothetical protein
MLPTALSRDSAWLSRVILAPCSFESSPSYIFFFLRLKSAPVRNYDHLRNQPTTEEEAT